VVPVEADERPPSSGSTEAVAKRLVRLPRADPPQPAPTVTPTAAPAPTVPVTGPGTFVVAAGQAPHVGTGELTRYTVEVETGLPFDPAEVAAVVDATLGDPRGWTAHGDFAFERTGSDVDVRVLVATPDTTDALCAPLLTRGEVSCRNGDKVVLNARRWAEGVPHYDGDLAAYRQYVVNHEMGHAIGFSHVSCPEPAVPAPVMVQQTYGLQGCTANPWPFP
jgi:hypothetical protein